MAEQTYLEAIRDGLREEMARDPAVYILGEDVVVGGPFGVTKDLAQQFGEKRVVNTPISEGTVVGLSVGAAILGFRPVVEIMFMDFITLAMDQLINHAAKLHYMSGGQLRVPLTIRVQGGAVGSAGAHHSQIFEAWFHHVPGLKVVMPSNPADAKGLLKAAIHDNNPVLYLEHRGLYWTRGEVPEDDYIVPIGVATTQRTGRDVTILALSKMVSLALEAAEDLASEGISAEVIDPRTLCPLDLETIVASVRKTSRLIVVHEAVQRGGAGAEIAAQVQEEVLDYLDSPILRVGAPFSPVPYSAVLEKQFVPGKEQIVDAVRKAMGRSTARHET
ncbi:MAG: alpha-ketoacid dehydrogenase subunit beta [Deltaproteobacteria bacterium]|nr:alpha-ketoacid dehydrogenase subunit beta [Deltaproteobacteria bacterium]